MSSNLEDRHQYDKKQYSFRLAPVSQFDSPYISIFSARITDGAFYETQAEYLSQIDKRGVMVRPQTAQRRSFYRSLTSAMPSMVTCMPSARDTVPGPSTAMPISVATVVAVPVVPAIVPVIPSPPNQMPPTPNDPAGYP